MVDQLTFWVPASVRTDSIRVVCGLFQGDERLPLTRGGGRGDRAERADVVRLSVQRPLAPTSGSIPTLWVPRQHLLNVCVATCMACANCQHTRRAAPRPSRTSRHTWVHVLDSAMSSLGQGAFAAIGWAKRCHACGQIRELSGAVLFAGPSPQPLSRRERGSASPIRSLRGTSPARGDEARRCARRGGRGSVRRVCWQSVRIDQPATPTFNKGCREKISGSAQRSSR